MGSETTHDEKAGELGSKAKKEKPEEKDQMCVGGVCFPFGKPDSNDADAGTDEPDEKGD